MAKGLTIPLSLDPREWIRGIRVTERTLDDLGGELRQVEDAGDRVGRALEDGFTDSARDIERTFERLGRSFDDEMRNLEQTADRSGRRAADNLEDNLERSTFKGVAGGLAAEAGSEFVESWGEAIRSGNPAEVIREVGSQLALIGGAVGGPIGAAAGLAGSLFVTQFIDTSQRLRGAVKTLVTETFEGAAEEAAESGRSIAEELTNAFVTEAQKNQALQDFYGVDNLLDAVQRASDDAKTLGVTFDTVRDAVGSVGAEQRTATRRIKEAEDAAQAVLDKSRAAGFTIDGVAKGWDRAAENASDAARVAGGLVAQADRLTAAQQRAADAARSVEQSWRGSASAVADMRREVNNIPRSVTVNVLNKLNAGGVIP